MRQTRPSLDLDCDNYNKYDDDYDDDYDNKIPAIITAREAHPTHVWSLRWQLHCSSNVYDAQEIAAQRRPIDSSKQPLVRRGYRVLARHRLCHCMPASVSYSCGDCKFAGLRIDGSPDSEDKTRIFFFPLKSYLGNQIRVPCWRSLRFALADVESAGPHCGPLLNQASGTAIAPPSSRFASSHVNGRRAILRLGDVSTKVLKVSVLERKECIDHPNQGSRSCQSRCVPHAIQGGPLHFGR